jgi:hypothetical protein
MRKSHAHACQPINVRRPCLVIPIQMGHPMIQVVNRDEQHIRASVISGRQIKYIFLCEDADREAAKD